MNIILVGAGEVGYTLAERLNEEGHDIVLIDKMGDAIERASGNLDVMTLHGSAVSVELLEEAGARSADFLIAVTNSDEMNMVCCLLAKRMGVQKTVARIRSYEYENDISLLHSELDIDIIINPERMVAMEISRLLRFPNALNIEAYCHGRVEIVEFRAREGDRFINMPLMKLTERFLRNTPVLFCGVVRKGQSFIPNGDTALLPGDYVYAIGETPRITAFFKSIGRSDEIIRNVMIIGAGRTSHYLARMCNSGMKLTVIDNNQDKCERFNELVPNALVLHGDGCDQDLLDSEGMESMDAVVTLTNKDEVNLISSMYANYCKVGKIITHVGKLNYVNILSNTNMDTSVVSTKSTIADLIVRHVRSLQGGVGSEHIQALHSIGEEHEEPLEVVEFLAAEGLECLNRKLKDIRIRKDILIGVIERDRKIIIPGGEDFMMAGDNVIVITKRHKLHSLDDILA